MLHHYVVGIQLWAGRVVCDGRNVVEKKNRFSCGLELSSLKTGTLLKGSRFSSGLERQELLRAGVVISVGKNCIGDRDWL